LVRFGFYKKFLKKLKPVQTDWFRFGFLGQKSVQTSLALFFSWFFSVWFFWFFAYKTKTKPAGFFKILTGLIGFFYGSVFSVFFFSVFSI
jgi:hypothetical protein